MVLCQYLNAGQYLYFPTYAEKGELGQFLFLFSDFLKCIDCTVSIQHLHKTCSVTVKYLKIQSPTHPSPKKPDTYSQPHMHSFSSLLSMDIFCYYIEISNRKHIAKAFLMLINIIQAAITSLPNNINISYFKDQGLALYLR